MKVTAPHLPHPKPGSKPIDPGAKPIGIVGGVGPMAGVDLATKIFQATQARSDQEHLDVLLFSQSSKIADRSAYLLKKPNVPNPGIAIGHIARELHHAGAEVIGIPCNTAHAAPIFSAITGELSALIKEKKIILVHMLVETLQAITQQYTQIRKLGLLATVGTYHSHVYEETARSFPYSIVTPRAATRKDIHNAIYHKEYGIKAMSPVSQEAVALLKNAATELSAAGAEAIIMGCTEIPLALNKHSFSHPLAVPLVDPTAILAQKLIFHATRKPLKG